MSNKIPESAWGDLIARRANNESVSSIARRYGCSPATVYSVLKKATGGAAIASESPTDGELHTAEQPSEPKPGNDPKVPQQRTQVIDADDPSTALPQYFPEREQKPTRSNALTAKLDDELRNEAEVVINRFKAAFEAALGSSNPSELEHLRTAASELARVGARTQIVVERLASTNSRQAPQPAPAGQQASTELDDADQAGTVRFFNSERGFGFATMDSQGPDVFIPGGALKRAGIAALRIGQRVRVTTRSGPKGPMAESVQLVS
jgi:CspA family cold shock protein